MIFFKNAFFSGIIAVIALWITLICVYTPSCPSGVFLAVSAAFAIALYSYRCQSWHTRGGMLLMLACAAVVGSGVILNCWYFTTASGGTDSAPVFQNFDASLNWEFLTMSNIEDLRTDRFPGICFNRTSGYPYLMALLCWPFGPSLAFLLGFNMLCVLLTIILCGSITRRCCPGHGLAAPLCGMCVLAANCYFMVTGTIFIKDALVQLIFAVVINLLCRMRHNSRPERMPAIGCLGALLLIALVRHQLIPLMVPGFIILLSGKRRLWPVLIMLCAFSAIVYTAVMMLPTHEQYDTVFSVLNGPRTTHPDRVTTFIVDNSRTELIYSITGNLDEQMPWMRLLWLPVTMLCQFLIPFPWNFTRDMIYGPSQLYAHISFPGYLAGIILGYYILFQAKKGPAPVNRLLAWGGLLYAAVAFNWSGSVSRYCLMFIPLAAPAISFCILTAWRRRSLYVWTSACAIILAGGLLICYRLSN